MMRRSTGSDVAAVALTASMFSFFGAAIAAYITHICWIISTLMTNEVIAVGKIVIALLGVVVPPFGCVHGVYLWFNGW